jgi:hypothetical protein
MSTPDIRAGDADRDRVITRLREAFAEGRLTDEEFRERMDRAQQARTFGELAVLTDDLPHTPATVTQPAATRDRARRDMRQAWRVWVGVAVLVNVIWAFTWISDPGAPPAYWPIWVFGPWGVVMALATWNSRRDRADG